MLNNFFFMYSEDDDMMGGRNPDRPTSLLELQTVADDDEITNLKRMNKISSPERWEIKQVNQFLTK